MFKEFGVVIMLIGMIFYILKLIIKKKNRYISRVILLLLFLSIAVSLYYNFKNVYPNYNYEGVSIGDSSENLFTYKKDSEFQWQILFPVLKNREVFIHDSEGVYTNFMDTYAKNLSILNISEESISNIISETEWDTINLSVFLQLDYMFPYYVYDDAKGFPMLKMKVEELRDSTELVAYVDEENNLYIMTRQYFDSLDKGGK